jgi:hypothetical protein
MTAVPEPADRARIHDTGDTLEVVIPIDRDWFKIIFHTFWICLWIWGGTNAIKRLWGVGGELHGDRMVLMLGLAVWTAGIVWGAAAWLWTITGVERARFRGDAIALRREVFGIGFTREFDASRVGKLRLADNLEMATAGRRVAGLPGGRIVFDYEETFVRFGLRLERGEAARLILKIQKRFAFTRT